MEGTWRQAQNTRRMDSARSGNICWHFMNGSCRLGPRCNFRHEWPNIQSSQICRYFQKGGCWYGDRCKYLHVLQSEVDAAVADRRSSVPTVSSSSMAYRPTNRRGSEPALLRSEVMFRQEGSRSGLTMSVSNPQRNIGHLAADIAEEQSQDSDSHLAAPLESSRSSAGAQACAHDGRNEQCFCVQETSSNETTVHGAAAATASSSAEGNVEEMEAFLQSKSVTCGICMDKVYEKPDPRARVFGILPNCNHPFCLQCIMTWRKTKDLGPDTVKSCPQCRVRSPFYVPNKYWLEGQAKESAVTAFKEKFSKKSCSYYTRYGWCPFKTECLYRHEKHARRRSIQYPSEDEEYDDTDLLGLFVAMTIFGGGDDDSDYEDYDFPFYLSDEYSF